MVQQMQKPAQRRRWGDAWSALAIPGLVFIVLGFGSTLVFAIARSLTDPSPANYLRLLDGVSGRALATTFQSSIVIALIVLVMGYIYAYAMLIGPKWLKIYLIAFLAIQFATSSVARAYAWVQLLQNNGVINKFLMATGLIDHPLKLMRNDLGAIIGTSHVLLPYMVLVLFASMRQVNLTTIVAARSLGANSWRALFEVFVPATRVGIVAGTGLVFVLGLSFYTTPALLGDASHQMISALVMNQAMAYGDFGGASTLAMGLVIITLLSLLLTRMITDRLNLMRKPSS